MYYVGGGGGKGYRALPRSGASRCARCCVKSDKPFILLEPLEINFDKLFAGPRDARTKRAVLEFLCSVSRVCSTNNVSQQTPQSPRSLSQTRRRCRRGLVNAVQLKLKRKTFTDVVGRLGPARERR